MMPIPKRHPVFTLFMLMLSVVAFGSDNLAPGAWEAARADAETEGKPILVAFLGSGWSLSSDKFNEAVLESAAFRDFAEANLVYFPIEARRKPKLSKSETAVLQSLVILFNVKSYPTILLLGPDGREWLRHGYRELTPRDYVQTLQQIIP